MARGKKRTYRKKKRTYRKKFKGRRTKVSTRSKRVPFTNSKPKSRLVLLTDRREYSVWDNENGTVGQGTAFPIPPQFIMRLNDPLNFWPKDDAVQEDHIRGTWTRSDYSDNTVRALPNLDHWLCNSDGNPDDAGSLGAYRQGNVISAKVTITGKSHDHTFQIANQGTTVQSRVAVQTRKVTQLKDIEQGLQETPSATYNHLQQGGLPGTKTTYSQTPQYGGDTWKTGAFTHVIKYSFANMNKGRKAMDNRNIVTNDTQPAEKDFLKLSFMPTEKDYAATNHKVPKMRVTIKVEMVLACTEPSMKAGMYGTPAGQPTMLQRMRMRAREVHANLMDEGDN